MEFEKCRGFNQGWLWVASTMAHGGWVGWWVGGLVGGILTMEEAIFLILFGFNDTQHSQNSVNVFFYAVTKS